MIDIGRKWVVRVIFGSIESTLTVIIQKILVTLFFGSDLYGTGEFLCRSDLGQVVRIG